MDYKKEYGELKSKIRYHMVKYYDEDTPEISDAEYDALMLRLKELEKEHPGLVSDDSPTRIIGGSAKWTAGVNVEHDVPMLSIQDVFSKEEVLDWVHEVRELHPDVKFDVEQKIDGLSMSIRYEDGRLTMAETRGDGFTGEDVTANALVIPDVVKELKGTKDYLEVRGEVYMSHESFERVNEKQELAGKKLFANPRNCAAGTLRQLDSQMVKDRGLSMMIFNVQKGSPDYMTSHTEALNMLKGKEGMNTVPSKLCTSDEEILDEIERIGELRGQLPYDIDGAVIKIDRIDYRRDFPAGSKYSAGHIAYKYPPEEKESVIRQIELSVGMTGRINPTAVFDPIRLCGTMVSRATLHNQDFIDELGIGIGQTVIVYKSGEIIPKIKGVNKDKAPAGGVVFKIPDTCPVCHFKVVRLEETADMKCTNPECPAKIKKRIVNFVGRDAMDIKGFGPEYIGALCDLGYIRDISDIYRLKDKRDELVEKGLIGKEKNTDKLLKVIEDSKSNDPERLLSGLAIENVGKNTARTIMRHFKSFDLLMNAGKEELTAVDDVGEITAASVYDFFRNEGIIRLIKDLKDFGLKMEVSSGEEQSDIFAGRTYVITGDLTHFKNRDELIAYIENRGGKVAGSVSKKTWALINNDAASASGKNKKAKALGISIITEEELLSEEKDL
ncbi:MAG: NAD-dependent DNA ligase LigA [Lachnospiraceae bacterium]|nr:NAD-dependent DNA ligase LigA [Lachnospiraceae bacterium]